MSFLRNRRLQLSALTAFLSVIGINALGLTRDSSLSFTTKLPWPTHEMRNFWKY